jgi:acyl-CoA synthetase (AMP-forming)/AMP-acid ligase II
MLLSPLICFYTRCMSGASQQNGSALLGWLDSPRGDHGIRVFENGEWRLCDYPSLAARVNGMAAELQAAQLGHDARVAVVASNPVHFAVGFFGALYSGTTPVPIPPPALLGRSYADYAGHLMRTAAVSCVVVEEDLRPTLEQLRHQASDEMPIFSQLPPPLAKADPCPPAELALVQFTSGSTSKPRAVRIRWEALEAQIAMLRSWLQWGPDDVAASWLPLHHDMGLIGALLGSVCNQTDLWYMSPERFMRRPLSYLRCLGREGVTLTTSPTFGYAYAARHVKPDELVGADFSTLRAAVVGAERINLETLCGFAALTMEYGFRWESFRPAYGLAEATLAVTGTSLAAKPGRLDVDWASLSMGAPVLHNRRQGVIGEHGEGSSSLVSCGPPLDGVRLRIVDRSGVELPPGHVGEIAVSGPAVADGYDSSDSDPSSTRFVNGELFTGDAGFVDVDGDLFVIGRIADSINARGRRFPVEQLEEYVAEAGDVPISKCVVVPGHGSRSDELIVLVEASPGAWVAPIVTALLGVIGRELGLRIYATPPHSIPRTTSGKKRRRAVAQQLREGVLKASLMYPDVQPLAQSGDGWQDSRDGTS